MATEKVGVYRKYYSKVPTDVQGKPMPKSEWPKKRSFSWAVRWFGTEGNRYSQSFKSRKEAERFAETKQQHVRSGKADKPTNITLAEFSKEHLALMDGQLAPKSISEHRRALRYLGVIIGNPLLQKITSQDAERYVTNRHAAGTSASTINKEIATLRRVFTLAANRRGYLPEGQNCFAKVAKRKLSCKPLRYVSECEFGKLLQSSTNLWWKVFLCLLYTTGLRLDEARNLLWQDIDFARGLLHVAAKRNKDVFVPWEPKDHELRVIPLCSNMVDLLTKWQTTVPEQVPYVFLSAKRYNLVMSHFRAGCLRRGQELINNVLRDFRCVQRRAAIPRCTIHDLRRSCITNWARQLPAHVVRKLAGHSSLETTMRYYLVVEEHDLEGARHVAQQIIKSADIVGARHDVTDPKMTHSAKKEAI